MNEMSSFAGWAVMAMLVLGVTAISSLTLIVQMLLTGRMGLRRKDDHASRPEA